MSAPTPTAELAAEAAALEVSFDGHRYRFRAYRYDRLDDALRYARIEHALPGFAADPAFRPLWLPAWQPDAAQRGLMARWHIAFEGGRFALGPWRYDRLDDAVAYAQRTAGTGP